MGSVIFNLVGFAILGAVIYVLDRNFGVSFRRGVYNATHGTKLRREDERGFVYKRLMKARVGFAALLMTTKVVIAVFFQHQEPFSEVLESALQMVALVAGFYGGPFADRLAGNTNAFLDKVETIENRVEKGETTLAKEAAKVARDAGDRFRSTVSGISTADAPSSTTPVQNPPDQPKAPEPPPVDTGKGLDDFLGRKG